MKSNFHQYVLGAALLGCCLSTSAKNVQFEREKNDLSKSFNWYDPGLQEMLWEGQSEKPPRIHTQFGLDKRASGDPVDASGRRTFGPAIPIKCIFCQDKRSDDPNLSMSDFTRDRMVARMNKPPRWDLPCLFYSQRPFGKDPPSLSETATKYACSHNMRSIWMLWPYDKNTCGEENYYCLYEKCCWLAPLMQSGTEIEQQRRRLEYFGYMSAAMAATCMDQVWIMTDDLANVPYDRRDKPLGDQATGLGWQGRPVDPSIWLNDELPMLRELYRMGRIPKGIWTMAPDGTVGQQVNYILEREQKPAVKTREESVPKYNMTELILAADEERRRWYALPGHVKEDIIKRDNDDRLMKRDSCTGACNYQPWGEDWFG